MKINDGRITILFDDEGLTIELRDNDSATTFAKARLNPKGAVQAMSRLGHTHCELEVFDLDKLGKKMEIDKLEFQMTTKDYTKTRQVARELAIMVCPKGWEPDLSFNSQNSFFYKDDLYFARTTIRRWK